MTALTFRRAHASEAEIFARLHARCFDSAWDVASFARLLARKGALGLLACGGPDAPNAVFPSAFALFEQVADEAEILTFGVDPDVRGRHVGSRLLARGMADLAACGVRQVYLEVAQDNVPARALYRSAGFALSGRRPGYYRRNTNVPPVDGLVFSRRLDPR